MKIVNNFGGIDKEIYNIGDILHKVGKNYLRALPIVCNEDGEDFEDYRIYGAAGGVGDRTENLFDKSMYDAAGVRTYNCTVVSSSSGIALTATGNDPFVGQVIPSGTSASLYRNTFIPCDPNTTYTISASKFPKCYVTYIDSENVSCGAANIPQNASKFTFTTPTDAAFLLFRFGDGEATSGDIVEISNIVFVEGSTAPAEYVPYGYEVDMSVRSANLFDKNNTVSIINNYYIKSPEEVVYSANYYLSAPLSVTEGDIYTWTRHAVTLGSADGVGFFDENDDIIGAAIPSGSTSVTFTIPVGCDHIRLSVHKGSVDILMLTSGSTAPAEYVPYGTTSTAPIYISSDPLEADEYVDYEEGKIYRMVNGVLTPTDPPVPLPSIPTVNGKTTVNYAGTGTAPEKVWFSGMEFEIEDVYFGDKHIFSVWGEYDGTLPVQFNANGENLVQYQVYGNTGGVGDATSGTEPAGYKVPITVFDLYQTYNGTLPAQYSANGLAHSNYCIYGSAGGVGDKTENLYNWPDTSYGYEIGRILTADGTTAVSSNYCISSYIEVDSLATYTINWYEGNPYPSIYLCEYDENYNFISSVLETLNQTFTTQSTTKYLRLTNTYRNVARLRRETCVLVEGSTAPAAYVPFGYVVPMSVSNGTTSTTTPIYIGSNPLNANGEYADYVDYQSQKIKRRIKTRIFDGSETFTPITNKTGCYQLPINDHINNDWVTPYSSNYYTWWQWIGNGAQYDMAPDKSLFGFYNYGIYIKNLTYLTSEDLKNHIKELYDAGTPLTVTYVTREYYDTDPPVPLPVLPTCDGTTIVDYAGQSVAPSRFYGEYINSPILPIYIGSSPLGEDEYVDYGEGKIYRKNPANYFDGYFESGAIDYNTGAETPSNTSIRTDFIELEPSNRFYIKWKIGSLYILPVSYDENKNYVKYLGARSQNPSYFDLGANEKYIRFYLYNETTPPKEMMVCKNANAPYYDPQDPPVPLPALPTVDGTTIMSYAGQSMEPNEFYAKYRKQNF